MGVSRFEDLRVWQAAKQQCDRLGALLERPAFRRDRELSGQMNGAALSVMFNISEGFLRRRDRETLQVLAIRLRIERGTEVRLLRCPGSQLPLGG
jgi:hypothetical protein